MELSNTLRGESLRSWRRFYWLMRFELRTEHLLVCPQGLVLQLEMADFVLQFQQDRFDVNVRHELEHVLLRRNKTNARK